MSAKEDARRIARKLEALSGRVNNVVFRPLVASVADAFVAQAKTRVPVRTGKLRDAIKVDTSRAEATDTLTRAVVHVASDQKKKGGLRDIEVAFRMFERWRQENYFKYMREEYMLDALVDYQIERVGITRLWTLGETVAPEIPKDDPRPRRAARRLE